VEEKISLTGSPILLIPERRLFFQLQSNPVFLRLRWAICHFPSTMTQQVQSLMFSVVRSTFAFVALLIFASIASAATLRTERNVPIEITFNAKNHHADPFNDTTLDIIFTQPNGAKLKVPAFWDGTNIWKVCYASDQPGTHHWTSQCSDKKDRGLHNIKGSVKISTYKGTNIFYQHGPIRVSADKRHFEHADGTPFFWLGDTWWMGLCHRLHFPDEFQQLTADRVQKGFNVIQLVAGLYPDMFPFDPRGANEAGFPWQTNYSAIRPEYFDAADKRLRYLVDQGMSPCIVGAWGYFLPWMGVEKAKQHWRYLIARYGALPVTWCIAGEDNLPWYLAKGFPYDDKEQAKGWTDVARYVRETDPFHRMTTIHPTGIEPNDARHAVSDETVLDYNMLQTPHGQREAVAPTYRLITAAYALEPVMPILDGEASYDHLSDTIATDWPRAMFWIDMLNGAAGHTYGANGIWQCNRREQPHGNSPHGGNYGKIPWDEAMNLPASKQIGAGKKFLEQFPWRACEPMSSTISWPGNPGPEAVIPPCCLGIANDTRIFYALVTKPITLTALVPDGHYRYTELDPVSCQSTAKEVIADSKGKLELASTLTHDWAGAVQLIAVKSP
jgi:hypothetical protein